MRFIQDAHGSVAIYTKGWRYVGHFFAKEMKFAYVTACNCEPYILITSKAYECSFVYEPRLDDWEVKQ